MKNGFVLVFTVLIITILLIITLGIFAFVSSQIKIIRDESEAAKAQYAADTGIECVRYYQSVDRAFDTTQPPRILDCGVGTLNAGISSGPDCVDYTYVLPALNSFSNGACVFLTITVTAKPVIIHGVSQQVCEISVESRGQNSCSASPENLVQQFRNEKM